jgi:hypothetical protein
MSRFDVCEGRDRRAYRNTKNKRLDSARLTAPGPDGESAGTNKPAARRMIASPTEGRRLSPCS